MRRLVPFVMVMALFVPSNALANDHLMEINELIASFQGDPAAQFVELRDPANEGFPFTYRLASYDAAGNPVSEKPLNSMALQNIGTAPYLVATAAFAAAAPTPAPHEQLPANFLPQGVGQVCFEQGMAVRRIACVAYGCPANVVTSAARKTLAPTDTLSVQRQGSGQYALAAETAGEPNISGQSAACSGGPGGGGGGGGGGGPGDDTTDPKQTLAFGKRQDVDKLAISVTLDEAATVVVKGSVNVPGAAAKVKVRRVSRSVPAGRRTKIRVKLKRKAKRRVKAALANGKKPKASLTVTATDPAGNVTSARPRIKLKD